MSCLVEHIFYIANLNNLFRFSFCYLSTDDLQISQEASYQPRHDCTTKESPYFREMCRPIVCWKMYRCNLGILKDSMMGFLWCFSANTLLPPELWPYMYKHGL